MNKDAETKLLRARTSLILSEPFFASMLLRLEMVEDSTMKPPTMCTNGKVIRYNPDFVMKQSFGKLKGLLCHETLHPALGHPFRRGSRDPKKWNQATDYVVNEIVKNAGMELPDEALINSTYGSMTAEGVYQMLPDPPPGDGKGNNDGGGDGDSDGDNSWNIGGVEDGQGKDGKLSEAEKTQQEEEWKMALAQATEAAKSKGKLPAGMDRLIEDVLEPKLDWRTILRRFIEDTIKNNYAWNPPNRRYVHQGLYLPSLVKDETISVAIGVDTSGSIGQEELNDFAAEITGILAEFRSSCDVIYCDSAIQHVQHFDYEDFPVTMEAKGGGGTDMPLLVSHIEQMAEQPKCMLIFTDMITDFPDRESEVPVMWVTHNETVKAPFGETLVF